MDKWHIIPFKRSKKSYSIRVNAKLEQKHFKLCKIIHNAWKHNKRAKSGFNSQQGAYKNKQACRFIL